MNSTSMVNPSASPERPPLPDAWVERLFQRFEDWYGAKWAAQFGAFPRDRVKRTWAEELAGFRSQPDRLAHALDIQKSAPFPPTLPEFLTLCRQAPRKDLPAIAYQPTPEEAAKAAEYALLAKSAVCVGGERDHLAWARKPVTRIAMSAVFTEAARGDDVRFREIAAKLVADGRADERGAARQLWTGQEWTIHR